MPDAQAPTFTTETLVDTAMPVAQEHAKNGESIEETTRKIFEKIIQAKNAPSPAKHKPNISTQKQAKKKKALLAKQAQEKKERERLAKKQALKEQLAKEKQREESKKQKAALLAAAKKKQEMLATMKAQAQEQERLAKEQEKQTLEETKNALMVQKMNQEKRRQEKRRREKAQKEALKREKLQKKAKLAAKEARKKQKEKLAKQKLEKQKLTKQKQQQKRALEKKLAQKRAAKKSTKGKSTKQHRSKYTNSGMGRATQQMIHEFYGDEFSHFTGTQQKFIEKNLGNIYIITQRVLSHKGYPFTAKQRHQQGVQLVTFYLHPNGRISKLRFLQRAKYKVLNDNTLKIIRQAHSTYPKPKTTTKITFFVVYTLH